MSVTKVIEADVLAILRGGRKLIADGWTKKTFARSASGKIVNSESKEACQFCAVGALERASLDFYGSRLVRPSTREAHKRLARVMVKDSSSCVEEVNDKLHTTQAMVYDAYTLALLGAWKGL